MALTLSHRNVVRLSISFVVCGLMCSVAIVLRESVKNMGLDGTLSSLEFNVQFNPWCLPHEPSSQWHILTNAEYDACLKSLIQNGVPFDMDRSFVSENVLFDPFGDRYVIAVRKTGTDELEVVAWCRGRDGKLSTKDDYLSRRAKDVHHEIMGERQETGTGPVIGNLGKDG